MNKQNLLLLADFLWSLPDDQEKFCMSRYFCNNDKMVSPLQANNDIVKESFQSACSLGHSLFVEGLPEPTKKTKGWGKYGTETFGIEPYTIAWSFLFSSFWETVDNTPRGAAKRIYYFIENCEGKGRLQIFDVLCHIDLKPESYQNQKKL